MKNPIVEERLAKFSALPARSPDKDLEHNGKALMKSFLNRVDVAGRGDLASQQALLSDATMQIRVLESRVAELEMRLPSQTAQVPGP